MPSEFVVVTRSIPVAVPFKIALALGMTAFEGSCTEPRTTPRPVWAAKGTASRTDIIAGFLKSCVNVAEIMSPPPKFNCGEGNNHSAHCQAGEAEGGGRGEAGGIAGE